MGPIDQTVRQLAWRLGRRLYCAARGDLANDPHRNGEYWLLDQFAARMQENEVLFDVGANVGEWTLHALATSESARKSAKVFAFEPSAATFALLQGRLADRVNVQAVPLALTDRNGEGVLFSNCDGSGTNSLNPVSGTKTEHVRTMTIDAFMSERKIAHVGMMKIDTEGFDLKVLQGSEAALSEGRIDLIQFEYNWRWLLNKASLLELFEFLRGMPYRFGKLAGKSVMVFEEWHFELDRYFENNYVLIRKGSRLDGLGREMRFDNSNVALCVDKRN